MTLPRVIGELTPTAFDELISQLLTKYNLPRPNPDDDATLEEALAGGASFDDIRIDIYQALQRELPLAGPLALFTAPFLAIPPDKPLSAALTEFAEKLPADLTVGNTIHRYIYSVLDPHLQRLADQLTLYALTGKTSPTPESMLGGAFVLPIPGQPLVGLIVSRLSDTKMLIRQFRQKFKETFPTKPRQLSPAMIPVATALHLKLEGYKLKDIADIHMSRHPSQFPQDPLSAEYKAAKKTLEQQIKKQTSRLKQILHRMGDT